MKLISMTDFVLVEQMKLNQAKKLKLKHLSSQYLDRIFNYANFLKQPLKLEMFAPCDDNENVLEQPQGYKYWIKDDENGAYNGDDESKCKKYQQAKQKVLFEGFDLSTAKFHCDRNDRTIEYFTSFEVELTPNAIKRIFG